ncbi:MAG: D-aminoacyl-tRNA deacylase [Pseudomonadota bacterium]
MLALLQRVTRAEVTVARATVARIDAGLLVFVGVQQDDKEMHADKLAQRLLGYRVFADKHGKMNLSVQDINGALLLVPQFTLAADTHKGMRPSFTLAAAPQQAEYLFNHLLHQVRIQHGNVHSGRFGADMQVSLINDGPVTFLLNT